MCVHDDSPHRSLSSAVIPNYSTLSSSYSFNRSNEYSCFGDEDEIFYKIDRSNDRSKMLKIKYVDIIYYLISMMMYLVFICFFSFYASRLTLKVEGLLLQSI